MTLKDLKNAKTIRRSSWGTGIYLAKDPNDIPHDTEIADEACTPEANVYQFVPILGVRKIELTQKDKKASDWEEYKQQ